MAEQSASGVQTRGGDLRLAAIVSYGLFLLALCSGGFTAAAGVVIAHIKRGDARGTPYESHFRNLIAVFWTSFVLIALFGGALVWGILDLALFAPDKDVAGWLFVLPIAWFAGTALLVWYLYRTIGGLVRALEGSAY